MFCLPAALKRPILPLHQFLFNLTAAVKISVYLLISHCVFDLLRFKMPYLNLNTLFFMTVSSVTSINHVAVLTL